MSEAPLLCTECRFGLAEPNERARCFWARAQDEAGDRMPRWAHALIVAHPHATGANDRAEDCPAFEREDA